MINFIEETTVKKILRMPKETKFDCITTGKSMTCDKARENIEKYIQVPKENSIRELLRQTSKFSFTLFLF